MSNYVGARSHASQVAADHRSRIAAGNAARLAAAGLALFLTFGFGGVAQAAADRAPEQARDQGRGAGVDGSAGTTPAADAGDTADAGPADKGTEVIEISAVSTDATAATLVTATTVNGVTTTETTTVPVDQTAAAPEQTAAARTAATPATTTVLAKVKDDKEKGAPETVPAPPAKDGAGADLGQQGPGSSAGTPGQNAGKGDGGTYVETVVCHKDGVVITIDDSGLNGHAADSHGEGHLEGVSECVDSDGDGVLDLVDGDPNDPRNTDVVGPDDDLDDDCAEGVEAAATGASAEPAAEVAECDDGAEGDDDAEGGDGDADCDELDETCEEGDEVDDENDGKLNPTLPGDKVQGPGTKGPGTWNDGGKKTGGKKSEPEVLGEESERPRGGKPGQGGTTVVGVEKTPGDRLQVRPAAAQDDPSREDEVLGRQAEQPGKNRPAALVLPDTGAGSSMAAQAGAGLVMLLGGALTLRGRRRDGHS